MTDADVLDNSQRYDIYHNQVFGTIAACVLDCWVGYQYIPDGHFYSGTDAYICS